MTVYCMGYDNQRISTLRQALLDAWAAPDFNPEEVGQITRDLQMLVRKQLPQPQPKTLPNELILAVVRTAAKETGAKPEDIFDGSRSHPVARARIYAALALQVLNNGTSGAQLARAVGISRESSNNYYSSISHRLRVGRFPWFRQAALARVIATARANLTPT